MYPVSILPAAQNPPPPPEVGLKTSEIDIRNGLSIKRGGLRRLSIPCQMITSINIRPCMVEDFNSKYARSLF